MNLSKFFYVLVFIFSCAMKSVLLLSEEKDKSCGCSSLSRETESDCTSESSVENDPAEKYRSENQQNHINRDKIIFIKGGEFFMGTNKPIFVADGEGPSRLTFIDDFYLDIHEVSNSEFELFVNDTGYITEVLEIILNCFLLIVVAII